MYKKTRELLKELPLCCEATSLFNESVKSDESIYYSEIQKTETSSLSINDFDISGGNEQALKSLSMRYQESVSNSVDFLDRSTIMGLGIYGSISATPISTGALICFGSKYKEGLFGFTRTDTFYKVAFARFGLGLRVGGALGLSYFCTWTDKKYSPIFNKILTYI